MSTFTYSAAQEALYAEIERQTKELESLDAGALIDAEVLTNLATAFRLVNGGPQPGSSTVVNN